MFILICYFEGFHCRSSDDVYFNIYPDQRPTKEVQLSVVETKYKKADFEETNSKYIDFIHGTNSKPITPDYSSHNQGYYSKTPNAYTTQE